MEEQQLLKAPSVATEMTLDRVWFYDVRKCHVLLGNGNYNVHLFLYERFCLPFFVVGTRYQMYP